MNSRPQLQVAFLTGQSKPRTAALTPAQARFLVALPITAKGRVWENFPYPSVAGANVTTATECHGYLQKYVPVPLPVASVRNALHYLSARRAGFAERHRPAVEAMIARAECTLFLAGSCGLELFNHLGLSAEIRQRVTILAYGPVARRRPDCACVLVQGRHDWLSRWYFPQVDARVDAGHLHYLADPTVLRLATELVQRLSPR